MKNATFPSRRWWRTGVMVLLVAGLIYGGWHGLRAVLRSHATTDFVETSRDKQFSLVFSRYPVWGKIPEILGFGQGFVSLRAVNIGQTLEEKTAKDLDSLRSFQWSADKVVIFSGPYHGTESTPRFVEWTLPANLPLAPARMYFSKRKSKEGGTIWFGFKESKYMDQNGETIEWETLFFVACQTFQFPCRLMTAVITLGAVSLLVGVLIGVVCHRIHKNRANVRSPEGSR